LWESNLVHHRCCDPRNIVCLFDQISSKNLAVSISVLPVHQESCRPFSHTHGHDAFRI
jgi:hypothetical protein